MSIISRSAELQAATKRLEERYQAFMAELLNEVSDILEATLTQAPTDTDTGQEAQPASDGPQARFAVGDSVVCRLGCTGKIAAVRTNVLGGYRYQLEGFTNYLHGEDELELAKPPETPKPTPKYRVGDFVRTQFATVQVVKVLAKDSSIAYEVRYPTGETRIRLEDGELLGRANLPTPHFLVGDRIALSGKGGYVIGVHLVGDTYRVDLRFDDQSTAELYDPDYGRSDDPATAHNQIEVD